MFRRNPILTTLALLFLTAAVSFSIIVARLDLNSYRQRLEAELTQRLGEPVQIGHASLTLRGGPALTFTRLRIGKEEDLLLQAEFFSLKPDPFALLRGKVAFGEMVLESPSIRIPLSDSDLSPGYPAPPDRLFRRLPFRSLIIRQGRLEAVTKEGAKLFELRNLEARIKRTTFSRRGSSNISALLIQGEAASPFRLKAVWSPSSREDWREGEVSLDLSLDDFSPHPAISRFANDTAVSAVGKISLDLSLNGSPSTGLRLRGTLSGSSFSLAAPSLYESPLPLSRVNFHGIWFSQEGKNRLEDLRLKVDDLALNGNLILFTEEEKVQIEGELSSPLLPLDGLVRLFPNAAGPSVIRSLGKGVSGGSWQLGFARLSGPLAGFLHPEQGFPLRAASATLEGCRWRLPDGSDLQGVSAVLKWEEERLRVREGKLSWRGTPVLVNGEVSDPLSEDPEITAEGGAVLSEEVLSGLAERALPDSDLTGIAPLSFSLEGTPRHLLLDLESDLENVAVQWQEILSKKTGEEGKLFLTAELNPEFIGLNHGRLHLPFLDLRGNGSVRWEEKGRPFQFSGELLVPDLNRIRPNSPLLSRLESRGGAELRMEIAGDSQGTGIRSGTLFLRAFGMKLGAIADLNEANGEISFHPGGASIERLSARLGSSPVTIGGSLRGFKEPRLELTVNADAIRADELIFSSPRMVLRDIDGRLVLEPGKVLFEPVRVRLEGGTDATVRGSVDISDVPRVTLDIESTGGNIDEVIALWEGPRKKAGDASGEGPRKSGIDVTIAARMSRGTLSGLSFADAEGTITYQPGLLAIRPLHFRSGPGTYQGQVLLERQQDDGSLLKISGEVDNFEAGAIYQDLLHRPGLITGRLQGNFHLEGRPGSQFVLTSQGEFNLKIRDGILRKFPFLSKLFSLLNVSQIMKLQLPDMAQEGMPFNSLQGRLTLRNGLLESDSLLLDSNAMNLSIIGSFDLTKNYLDFIMGVKPLGTVDKIVTRIPVAGWLLTGEEKALITAHFEVTGRSEDPEVRAIPLTSVSEKLQGIFRRVLGFPKRMATGIGEIIEGEPEGIDKKEGE